MIFTFNGVDFLDRLEYLEAREDFRVQKEKREFEAEQVADRQLIINSRRIQKESIENEERHRIKAHKISAKCFFSLNIITITICITMSILFGVYNVSNPSMLSYYTTGTVTLLSNLEWAVIIIALIPILISVIACGWYSNDMSSYEWKVECFNEKWLGYDKDGFEIDIED